MDEGLRRARGHRDTPSTTAMPRKLFRAIGDESVRINGRTSSPGGVKVGARATLVAIGNARVLGVLEVTEVSDEGDVVMLCVDPVKRSYWDRQDTDDYVELAGVQLVAYDPDSHHGTLLTDAVTSEEEED